MMSQKSNPRHVYPNNHNTKIVIHVLMRLGRSCSLWGNIVRVMQSLKCYPTSLKNVYQWYKYMIYKLMPCRLYELSSHKKKRMKESWCEKEKMKNITKRSYHEPLEKNKLDKEVDLDIISLLHDEGPSEGQVSRTKIN